MTASENDLRRIVRLLARLPGVERDRLVRSLDGAPRRERAADAEQFRPCRRKRDRSQLSLTAKETWEVPARIANGHGPLKQAGQGSAGSP